MTEVDPSTRVRDRRRVLAACFAGTTIEYYDFFLYGAAAALVLAPKFFPSFSPLAGTLASFATFAVGFIARPLGGIVMGHLGDRVGRKSMLVASLLLMGLATVGIGLMPTYAVIGGWAPVALVLLRLIQGFATGGEWGAAALMAVEHAPANRRALFGSFPQMGVPAGLLTSQVVFLVMTLSMSPESFLAWGWRVPFLLSALLVAVGIYVRLGVAESPAFTQMQKEEGRSKHPLREVLRHNPRQVLLAGGIVLASNTIGYVYIVYALQYMRGELGIAQSRALTYVIAASAFWLVATAPVAVLSDRIGRRRTFLFGSVWMTVASAVFFPLLDTASPVGILVGMAAVGVGVAATFGPVAAMLAEMFKTRVRYSGASLGYQISTVLGGGLAPFAATAIFAATGTSLAITGYMVAVALITLVSALAVGRTTPSSLAESSEAGQPATTGPALSSNV